MGKSIPSYLRKSTKLQTNPTRSAASFPVRLFPPFSTFRGESRQRAGAAKVPRRVGAHRGIENGGRDGMLQQDAGRLRQGSGPNMMVGVRNLMIDECSFSGKTSFAAGNRHGHVPPRESGGTPVIT